MRIIYLLRLLCMVSVLLVFIGGAMFGHVGWHWTSVIPTVIGVGWASILFSFLLRLLQEALIEIERITSGQEDK